MNLNNATKTVKNHEEFQNSTKSQKWQKKRFHGDPRHSKWLQINLILNNMGLNDAIKENVGSNDLGILRLRGPSTSILQSESKLDNLTMCKRSLVVVIILS